VIGHQDIGVYLNAKAFAALRDDFQELLSVPIIHEDSPPLVAAAGHMAPGAKILDAQGTGREGMLLSKRKECQIKNKAVTPFTRIDTKETAFGHSHPGPA
jgi:hypothetical protein